MEGETISGEEIKDRLNDALVDGIHIINVYNDGRKLRDLSLLQSTITLEYDTGIPKDADSVLTDLFTRESLTVVKRTKNGSQDQDIIPMIRNIVVSRIGENELQINLLACCQNPTLNPTQIIAAIHAYAPEAAPQFARIQRDEIYDAQGTVFR